MLTHTICFITQGSRVLLLNRLFPPLMGQWNGVGGKIEPGETPLACILREITEETGLELSEVRSTGTVTWTLDGKPGGMYAYVAALDPDVSYTTPVVTPEGILDWKETNWVMDPRNAGVVSNIQRFLPAMLAGAAPQEHHFTYVDWRIVAYRTALLPAL